MAPADSPLGQLMGPARATPEGPLAGELVDPLLGTWVRMVVATAVLLGMTAVRRELGHLLAGTRDRTAMAWTSAGALFGPVLGVWLSLVAVAATHAAVAATIMAAAPVLVIPLAVWLDGERVSLRAVLGAVVAVGGVGILALREWIAGLL